MLQGRLSIIDFESDTKFVEHLDCLWDNVLEEAWAGCHSIGSGNPCNL